MAPSLALLSLLLAAPGWHDSALSDDPAVRAPTLAHLHAKGLPGLYAVQDLVDKSSDPEQRARAVRALGELGDRGAEWALRLELKQTDPRVLAADIRAIAALQLQTLSRPVAEKVGDPDPGLCAALGQAAAVLPDIAEAARTAVAGTDEQQQLAGLRILEAAQLPVAEDLLRKLTHGSAVPLRLAASLALGRIDPASGVEALAQVLDQAPAGPDADAAIAALGKLASPPAMTLLQSLMLRGDNAQAAVTALASTNDGARVLLRRRIAETVPAVIESAVDAALAGQPKLAELLLSLVADPDVSLAEAAAARLGQRPDGVEALVHCLQQLVPEANRCAAGLAASELGAAAVGRALQSLDGNVRALMVQGLGRAPKPTPLEVLAPLTSDPSADVRLALTVPLGRLEAAGLPALETLMHDAQPAVRTAAATQLVVELPADRLRALVAEAVSDPAIRSPVLSASVRLPSEDAIRVLVASLGDPNARERRAALTNLARYHGTQAVNAMMDSAAHDTDPALRDYALTLLANE